MKETIEFIKNLWSNKRTRALAILVLYGIFFIFVFALISSGETGPRKQLDEQLDESLENETTEFDLADIINYFVEVIGEDNFTYDSSTNLIIYNNEIYLAEEKPIDLVDYDLEIFKPVNMAKLLEASVLESTNHIEKTNTYLLKISDFERIMYNNEIINDNNIEIITYEDNSKIIIDLSNYYGYLVNIELRD